MGRWQNKLIESTWGLMVKLWTTQNDGCREWDKESCNSARREVLHKELEYLYKCKQEYPIPVQHLLQALYNIHIQESATKIADWLNTYKGTFIVTWSPD